jgi:hypothetical protein
LSRAPSPIPFVEPADPTEEPARELIVQPFGDPDGDGEGVIVPEGDGVCEGVAEGDVPALSVGEGDGVCDMDGQTSLRTVVESRT